MLGEMLCAGFATQNFSWIGSPAATELETVSNPLQLYCRFILNLWPGHKAAGSAECSRCNTAAWSVTPLAAKHWHCCRRIADIALTLVHCHCLVMLLPYTISSSYIATVSGVQFELKDRQVLL